MLVTQTQSPEFQLVLFPSKASETAEKNQGEPAMSAEMLKVFEEITGWVIGFEEFQSSDQDRHLASEQTLPAQGTYSIVDMSAQWPARKPTGHRAKCDQFIDHLDTLVCELQKTKAKLVQTQSLLEAQSPGAVEDDEAELFDCFVPRYAEKGWDRVWDEDFEIDEELVNDASARAVDPPFEGWRMAGSPGAVDGRYVDWKLSDDEQIEMFVGHTSSHDGEDREAKLTVDPLTHEYVLSGDDDIDFFLYDQKSGHLSLMERSNGYRQLMARDLVILSTSKQLRDLCGTDQQLVLAGDIDDMADQLAGLLECDEMLLCLQHCRSI